MSVTISSKLPSVGTTIFTKINGISQQYNAINLGQGFPDFPMDERLVALTNKAMKDGHNQYVHGNGLPALREVLADKINHLYGSKVSSTDEITVTPGATYALYTAITTIIQPGDEVIIFEPAYDSYVPNIEINGGVVVPISLEFPHYNINWEEVKQKVTAQTRAIMINSPHNPTGAILRDADMQELIAITRDTNIVVISDEVYEHLVYDGRKQVSVLSYPELYERSFVCFSFGKTYSCTGWKLGYSVAPAALMAEFRKVHQYNCFTCFAPAQYALAEFIPEKSYEKLAADLQERKDFFAGEMTSSRFKALPSYGTYFQLYSYDTISSENEYDFAVRVIKEAGVAAIPVSSFYKTKEEHSVLRFCFSKGKDLLGEAAGRLRKL